MDGLMGVGLLTRCSDRLWADVVRFGGTGAAVYPCRVAGSRLSIERWETPLAAGGLVFVM